MLNVSAETFKKNSLTNKTLLTIVHHFELCFVLEALGDFVVQCFASSRCDNQTLDIMDYYKFKYITNGKTTAATFFLISKCERCQIAIAQSPAFADSAQRLAHLGPVWRFGWFLRGFWRRRRRIWWFLRRHQRWRIRRGSRRLPVGGRWCRFGRNKRRHWLSRFELIADGIPINVVCAVYRAYSLATVQIVAICTAKQTNLRHLCGIDNVAAVSVHV